MILNFSFIMNRLVFVWTFGKYYLVTRGGFLNKF